MVSFVLHFTYYLHQNGGIALKKLQLIQWT